MILKKHNKHSVIISNLNIKQCSTNIICRNPRLAFIEALSYLKENGYIVQRFSGKIHKSADIAPSAIIEDGAELLPVSMLALVHILKLVLF